MRIAHEAPRQIMDRVQAVTDYDYCLVHLLEEDPAYLKFFREAKQKGRYVIMDCSLFELGTAFDSEKYYDWILNLQPDEYIVPDVWQDADANIKSFQNFSEKFDLSKLTGLKIGVLQGRTYSDFEKAYQFMDKNADKIAISFGYDFYLENWQDNISSKAQTFSRGRIELIKKLLENNIINVNKPHHLLGCGIPGEFSYYKNNNYDFITSVDTSHPVLSGMFGKSYHNWNTLIDKVPHKMVDVYENTILREDLNTILNNIFLFRDMCISVYNNPNQPDFSY